jgi:hypothetical protein
MKASNPAKEQKTTHTLTSWFLFHALVWYANITTSCSKSRVEGGCGIKPSTNRRVWILFRAADRPNRLTSGLFGPHRFWPLCGWLSGEVVLLCFGSGSGLGLGFCWFLCFFFFYSTVLRLEAISSSTVGSCGSTREDIDWWDGCFAWLYAGPSGLESRPDDGPSVVRYTFSLRPKARCCVFPLSLSMSMLL